MASLGSIADIFRFPVKSMAGERLESVELTVDGVLGDRDWALRDAATDKLVSAKRPRLWRSVLDCAANGTGDDVRVTLPDGGEFAIGDPALATALTSFLGRAVEAERATGPQQGTYESDWPNIEGVSLSGELELPTNLSGEGTSFIDVGILHVLTTASLRSLASAAPRARIDVRRFRPSFTIDTGDATGWPENDWAGRRLRIGGAVIALGDPAPRCIMTTVEQADLPAEPDVLQAIAANNRLETALGTFACLGCYASVETPGRITVGDMVEAI